VLEYLNGALLAVNLIGVLYLVIKSSFHKKVDYQQDATLKMLSNQEKIIRQMSDLKSMVENDRIIDQRAQEEWKAEILAALDTVAAVAPETKSTSNSGQHLLLNDRYKEIFNLQKKGLDAEQIAKELGKGYGEVAFILQLADQARS
jgi:hypothetical protein